MELLGIGPMELIFIVIIALIVLGPKDMAKAGRTLGKFMRDIVKSDTWKVIKSTSRELENLPNRMMREAGLEEEMKELNNFTRTITTHGPHEDDQTANDFGGRESPQYCLSGGRCFHP